MQIDDISMLHDLISQKVLVRNQDEQIDTKDDPQWWLFDFRRILMNGKSANLVAKIFYKEFKDQYPFQLCALEIAGVPLATSLMNHFFYKGHEDINAFFIRKSRKKHGLMRMIEGEVQTEKKIILVDDIMNYGNSFWRQIEVLEALGYRVDTVWSILRFRDQRFYQRFHNRDIKIKSLFTLDDFSNVLGDEIENINRKTTAPLPMPFKEQWIFKSPKPSLSYVIQKSQPCIGDQKIYFGADNQTFWALNQNDGSVAWQYQVGPHVQKKSIFSSPAFFKHLVIFGAYDGNIYALDRETGKKVWISFEADWIGSSPAVAKDLELVFVGCEFGLIRKLGGVVALNARTGEKVWCDYSHPAFTHSSPLYLEPHQQVVIGSNDGKARLYNAKTGQKIWEFTTFGGADYTPDKGGFGSGDIKASFVYDSKHDYIIFGSIDGFLYILERQTGHLVYYYKCSFGIWSTPYLYNNRVYFTAVDKCVRCLYLDTFKLVFEVNLDNTRIFSSPTVINDRLYVGTNAGCLHELDPNTGKRLGYVQTIERVTNTLAYNQKTDTYFLPTYANEIICLRRTQS